MEEIALGIDLGTSNSCISHFVTGGKENVEVINSEPDNKPTTPSFVQISEKQTIAGNLAKSASAEGDPGVFYGVKRLIGRLYDNVKTDIKKFYNFDVINKDGKPIIPLDYKGKHYELFPEHISAFVLKTLAGYAKSKVTKTTIDTVITVPANFNDYQRRSTIDAGKVAGLNVLKVISEPTAAALFYVYKMKLTNADMKLLVYDFGGGTLDVSLVHVVKNKFTILATSGNTTVGGMDIDREIVESVARRFKNKHKIDIYDDENKREKATIQIQAEEAKINLSSVESTKFVCRAHNGTVEEVTLSRTFLETLCDKLFKTIDKPIDEVLKLTNLKPRDIDDVIMIGGSSKMPYVRKMVEKKLGKTLVQKVDPDQAVSLGAAIYGAIFKGAKIDDFPAGIELRDVTPMKISMEVAGGKLEQLIPKNVVRPAHSEWQCYTTVRDGVDEISLRIYEGDSDRPSQCYKVGEFAVGVTKAKRGVEHIYARVDVFDDKITIYGVKEDPRSRKDLPDPLHVEERKNAHTIAELNKMKEDIDTFSAVIVDEGTPAEAFSSWLAKVKTAVGKIKDNKALKTEALSEVKKHRDWVQANEGASKSETEQHKKDMLAYLKEKSPATIPLIKA